MSANEQGRRSDSCWYKVSAIVPVYNRETYLRSCLETLAAQTLDGVEVVIVNDGSTDGSLAIAQEFAGKYSNFIVYSTENKGVSHARNYGAAMSRGDYLAFVDSDDEVDADYCKAMYEKATRDGNDMVVCRAEHIRMINGAIQRIPQKHAFFAMDNFRMENFPLSVDENQHRPLEQADPSRFFRRAEIFGGHSFSGGLPFFHKGVLSGKKYRNRETDALSLLSNAQRRDLPLCLSILQLSFGAFAPPHRVVPDSSRYFVQNRSVRGPEIVLCVHDNSMGARIAPSAECFRRERAGMKRGVSHRKIAERPCVARGPENEFASRTPPASTATRLGVTTKPPASIEWE